MKMSHAINQFHQLLKLRPAVARRIIEQFQPGNSDETVKSISRALKAANKKLDPAPPRPAPPRSDTCPHCGKNWRNCGHAMTSENETLEAKPYQARSLNIGLSILPPPLAPAPPVTEAQKDTGLAMALGNQQPKNRRIGSTPAAW